MVHSGKNGREEEQGWPLPADCSGPRLRPGTSQTSLRAVMETIRNLLSLGAKIVAVGKSLKLADILQQGRDIWSICWCHQALQLGSELGLLGHDGRKQMFDQMSENICFVLLMWMQPAWPEVSAFGWYTRWGPICKQGNTEMNKANLGDRVFPN